MSSGSDDESSSAQRSSTVCFLCRQRKTKCDRTLPSCGFCVKAKAECQYVPKPKKRGLRAGYVSELESRIDHLESELHDLKHERLTTAPEPAPAAFTPSSNANHTSMKSTPTSFPNTTLTSSWASTPAKRRRLNPESDAAITDRKSPPNLGRSIASVSRRVSLAMTGGLPQVSILRDRALALTVFLSCLRLVSLLPSSYSSHLYRCKY